DGDVANGCETDLRSDAANCGECGKACSGGTPVCNASSCVAIDLSGVFAQYSSENRTVYLWKTTKCAQLASHADFCTKRGLTWWAPKSQSDAQMLVDFAFGLDNYHTWIQVHGLVTGAAGNKGTLNGYQVIVDSPDCVSHVGNGFAAFRK